MQYNGTAGILHGPFNIIIEKKEHIKTHNGEAVHCIMQYSNFEKLSSINALFLTMPFKFLSG